MWMIQSLTSAVKKKRPGQNSALAIYLEEFSAFKLSQQK